MVEGLTVSAQMCAGITIATAGGEPLQMAAIDANGRVVAFGDELAKTVFRAAVEAHQNLWLGNGHLTAIEKVSSPT